MIFIQFTLWSIWYLPTFNPKTCFGSTGKVGQVVWERSAPTLPFLTGFKFLCACAFINKEVTWKLGGKQWVERDEQTFSTCIINTICSQPYCTIILTSTQPLVSFFNQGKNHHQQKKTNPLWCASWNWPAHQVLLLQHIQAFSSCESSQYQCVNSQPTYLSLNLAVQETEDLDFTLVHPERVR